MLDAAKSNAYKFNLSKVKLIHGDVCNLSFESDYFDVVLSINGFHVFKNKQTAYKETFRVLKNGGIFCGCMYIKGQNDSTDFFVRNFCERFGYFSPPYETLDTLKAKLKKIYNQVQVTNVESFAGFVCNK